MYKYPLNIHKKIGLVVKTQWLEKAPHSIQRWCFFQTLPKKWQEPRKSHRFNPSSRQATTPSPLPFPNSASFVCTGDGGFAALEPGGWCPPLESDNIKGWWDYTLKIYRWNPQKSFWKMIFLFKEMFFFLESQSYFFLGSTSRWCQWFSILWWLLQKKYSPKWWWFKWVFLHQMRPKKIRKNNPPTQHIQVRIFPTSKKNSPHQTPQTHHPIHHQIPHLAACTVGITGGADGAGWLGANGCTGCTAAGGTVGATLGAAVGGAAVGAAGGRIGIWWCSAVGGGLDGKVVERMVVFFGGVPLFFDDAWKT